MFSRDPSLPRGPRLRALQTTRYLTDAVRWYRTWLDRYGDPCLVPMMHGPVVVTADPEAIREIFTAEPHHFGIVGRDLLTLFVGEGSVLAAAGEQHASDRKLLMPAFHGDRMRAYAARAAEATLEEASRWRPGERFVALEASQAISLSVILRAVLGVEDEREERDLAATIFRYYDAQTTPLFIRHVRRSFGGFGPWARFVEAREALDAKLYPLIARRRREAREGDDILATMLSARYSDGSLMSDATVRDQVVTLIGAGHETTAIVLAWAIYFVHRHPEVLARVEGELDALGPSAGPEDLATLPYLEAVTMEALRLHPAVPEVTRFLERPLKLRGYDLPTGFSVTIAICEAHHRPDVYPSPDAFRPERFLDRRYTPFEFMPFGGGARRCLGAALAQYELKVVLGTLLRHFRFRLDSSVSPVPVRHGLLTTPKGGIPLTFLGKREARRPVEARVRAQGD